MSKELHAWETVARKRVLDSGKFLKVVAWAAVVAMVLNYLNTSPPR